MYNSEPSKFAVNDARNACISLRHLRQIYLARRHIEKMRSILEMGSELFIKLNSPGKSDQGSAGAFVFLLSYLVTISIGTLKIFATLTSVSMCLPVAAAKW